MVLELTPEQAERLEKLLKTSRKNGESQKKRHREKHLIAAEKLREGKGPRDIYRETGISSGATATAQKLMAAGEI